MKWNVDKDKEEWLVKWEDRPFCDATWEEAKMIQREFPRFHLEDKVTLQLGGIVRPLIVNTYKRRGIKGKEKVEGTNKLGGDR